MTFAELLHTYGIPTRQGGEHHHVRAGWHGFDCPKCSPNSGRFRAGWNGKWMNCWACGRLDTAKTLQELTGEPLGKVLSLLREVPTEAPSRPQKPRGRLTLPEGRGPLLKAHRDYLWDRGLDPDKIADLWGIQSLNWKLFVPIHQDGEVVSFSTRPCSPLKGWRHARPEHESIPIRSTLYGEDYCRETIVVCEGIGDVWKIGPPAVATYGVGYTKSQLVRIAKYGRRIILFDSDEEGKRASQRLLNDLLLFPGSTVNVTLDCKDPGSATRKQVREFRKAFLGE